MSDTTVTAPIALVGSGEFLPQMVEVDRVLLDGRVPRAAFLATAAGLEGDASINRWLSMGVKHYESMGVEPVPVRVVNRDDANDPALAALINNVGLVYLSGGNPGYLADTLRGTLVWAAIEAAWRSGTALGGCSAGAMALSADAPREVRGRPMSEAAGLSVVPHLSVIPHFDHMAKWDPLFMEHAVARTSPGATLVGVDEDTALVGGPSHWTVMGQATVTVFGAGQPQIYRAGDRFTLSGRSS
jgi:cyanophycinase